MEESKISKHESGYFSIMLPKNKSHFGVLFLHGW